MLIPGEIHRTSSSTSAAGGKAAHVAMVCRALGEQVRWIGFLGGATGVECHRGLLTLGIDAIGVSSRAETRTNLEIIEDSGLSRVTEVLDPGGPIDAAEVDSFITVCRRTFSENKDGLVVVFSGSLPAGVPRDLYATLLREAQTYGAITVLDTSGEALRAALSANPDVVKPNGEEAAAIVGFPIVDTASALAACRHMISAGARMIALSLGSEGLFCVGSEDSAPITAVPRPPVHERSCVGSGDASVAGIAVGIHRKLDVSVMIRLAAACGAANCSADLPGRITESTVSAMLGSVVVTCGAEAQKGVNFECLQRNDAVRSSR